MSDPLRVQGEVVAGHLRQGPDAGSQIAGGAAEPGQIANGMAKLPPVMHGMAAELLTLLNRLSTKSGSLGKGVDSNFEALKAAASELLTADAVAAATAEKTHGDLPRTGAAGAPAPGRAPASAPASTPAPTPASGPPVIDPTNL